MGNSSSFRCVVLICRAVPNKDKTTETAGFLIDVVVVNATDAEP